MPSPNLNKAFSSSLSSKDYEGLFEEFSESLETRSEAREACFKELAENPKNPHARLILARLYYLDEYFEFSIRELVELKKYSKLDSLNRLVDSFGAFGSDFLSPSSSKVSEDEEALLAKDAASDKSAAEAEKEFPKVSSAAFAKKSEKQPDETSSLSKASSAEEFEVEEELETVAELDFDSGFMDIIEDLDIDELDDEI